MLHADLLWNGDIVYEGQTFRSPSSWSLYVKRLVNPQRLVSACVHSYGAMTCTCAGLQTHYRRRFLQADDGWTSVKYRGELLKVYRPTSYRPKISSTRYGMSAKGTGASTAQCLQF